MITPSNLRQGSQTAMTTRTVATTATAAPPIAVTVLSDRRIITRVHETTGVPEWVIDCTPCRNVGEPTEFVLPESCDFRQSAAWADQVTEHFKRVHR
jgi:hypothetical protein